MPFKTTTAVLKFFEKRLRKVQKSKSHPLTCRERSEGGKMKMPTIFKYSGKEAKEVYVAGQEPNSIAVLSFRIIPRIILRINFGWSNSRKKWARNTTY